MPHPRHFRFISLLFALAPGVLASGKSLRPAIAQTPAAQIPLPKKWEVHGLIRDDKGQPVAGAEVMVQSTATVNGKNPPPLRLKSDAAGRFAGEVLVTERPQDMAQAEFDALLAEAPRATTLIHAPGFAIAQPGLRAGDNEITLHRGVAASGTVRDEVGKPVAAARVRVRYIRLPSEDEESSPFGGYINLDEGNSAASLERKFDALSDANGAWTIPDLPPGSNVYIALDDPRFLNQPVEVSLPATPDEAAAAPTEFLAKPGAQVTGRVLFPDGKPVANAPINAQVAGAESGYAQGRTAPDGTFSLSGLPAGKVTLQIAPPAEAWAPAGITGLSLVVGTEIKAPDITFGGGLVLKGTVFDAGSKAPLAGARVIADGPLGSATSTLSDAQGRYTVRAVAGQNRFYITTSPSDYLRAWNDQISKPIAAASTAAPDFALRRGVTLSGTALDEAGQPAKGATISSGGPFEGATTSVNAQGAWTLRGVDANAPRPGDTPETQRSTVTLQTGGAWEIVGDGHVPASGAAPIQLTLRRIERQNVTARVVTPEGVPVAGAKVRISILFDPTRGARRFENSVTNARGEVTLRNLRPEESGEIIPAKTGYTSVKNGVITRLNAQPGAARAADAIMTSLDGFVQGRVVDDKGAAGAGALVALLLPGDLRDAPVWAKADATGHFRLEKLRAGEVTVGAARGRDWGQVKGATGQEVEIKLLGAPPQPKERDVERAFALMAQWLDDDGPKPSYELTSLAAKLAFVDRDRAQKLLAELGGKDQQEFLSAVVTDLVQRDPDKNAAWGLGQISLVTDVERRESAQMRLAMAIADTDPDGAQQIYDSIAPAALEALKNETPKADLDSLFRYATLTGLAGRLKSADAPVWRDATTASIKRLSHDDQMFRISSFANSIAQGGAAGALQFINGFEPAMQVRALEDVIPTVAKRDLPAAQKLLAMMENLVAQPDLPVEADRNNGMYHPTPAHSLDVARLAVIKKLLASDPQTANALAQKLGDDGYGFKEIAAETAAHLPREQALPALREAFGAGGRGGYGEAGSRARIASLIAPFDAGLSEEFFRVAREKLTGREGIEFGDDYRESAAAYAFYRAESDPAQSRLLLENEWQRLMVARRARPKKAAPAGGYDESGDTSGNRLNSLAWAMAPLDFERAVQMITEIAGFSHRSYDDVNARRNLLTWLLSNAAERHFLSFEKPRNAILE